MQTNPLILMVEDEDTVLAANKRMLERRGYEIAEAVSYKAACDFLESNVPDLIILDIMLPDGSGIDICKKFREKSENPVIFLTGKSDISDKVEGLSLGGDYYITKPYQFDELLAVVRRLLERNEIQKQKEEKLTVLKKGNLELDIQSHSVTLGGKAIYLTGKEFALLHFFMKNIGREISNEEIYREIWKNDAVNDVRTVRKHIMNLRSKIKAGETDDFDIVTLYGKGYIFR